MTFKDLDEFLSVDPVEIPIRGKTYSFPGEISARAWLLVQKLGSAYGAAKDGQIDTDEIALTDGEEVDLQAELFGGIEREMAADGVTSGELKLVFGTLVIYHLTDQATAEKFWDARGEAPAPNREARRTKPKVPAKSPQSRGSRAG